MDAPFHDILSQLIVSGVFASVMSETDDARQDEGIFARYASLAIKRLNAGNDTGLVHHDVFLMWGILPEDERKGVERVVIDACDKLEEFPDVSVMNVADVNTPTVVDCGIDEIPIIIPASVEASRGINAIVPVVTPCDELKALYGHLSPIFGLDITQVHLWDIPSMSIVKPSGELPSF